MNKELKVKSYGTSNLFFFKKVIDIVIMFVHGGAEQVQVLRVH